MVEKEGTRRGRGGRESSVLLKPYMVAHGFQVSAHTCPRILRRELAQIFPGLDVDSNILAICTCQKAAFDLSEFGEDADREKDKLLERFISWANDVCIFIEKQGYFADFIDPCSGLPMRTANTTSVYSEVEGMELLLHYRSFNAGMCKVLMHPQWGTAVYPATLFTLAPIPILQQALDRIRLEGSPDWTVDTRDP